jgi:hypothetical protein
MSNMIAAFSIAPSAQANRSVGDLRPLRSASSEQVVSRTRPTPCSRASRAGGTRWSRVIKA